MQKSNYNLIGTILKLFKTYCFINKKTFSFFLKGMLFSCEYMGVKLINVM